MVGPDTKTKGETVRSAPKAAGLAMVIVCVIGASLASAHTTRYLVNINIVGAEPNFANVERYTGMLTSSKAACKRQRKVHLFREAPGADVKVAQATTNNIGEFKVGTPGERLENGLYYAKVKAKTLRRNRNHRHVCRADNRSNPIEHTGST